MEKTDSLIREQVQKLIEDFRLIDDDFMAAVFSDTACAELLLQIILERDDLHVKSVQPQYEIKNLEGRSVRLDIFAEDMQGRKYNVEIQRNDKGAVAQRARYNASLIDANITVPNERFRDIPQVYVIFITENDVLKGGLPLYHIDRIIRETGKPFDDGSHIVYVNSQVQDETKLGKLMHDFYTKRASDMNYPVLAERVRHYKESKEGNSTMCRSVEKLAEEQKKLGMKQGKEDALVVALQNVIKSLNTTVEQAMDIMGIPQEERPILRKKLAQ